MLIEKKTINIIFVLRFLQQLSIGVYERCQDALYNIEVVTSCPKSKEEWDIAASNKNCSEIAAVAKANNCTIDEKEPKYHCVINAVRTNFLEVCADEKMIFGNILNLLLIIKQGVGNSILINAFNIEGHCTEFNEVGRIIQIHNTAECEKVFPNCDDAYSSVDAYKCMYAHTKDTLINNFLCFRHFVKYD